jgi:hypothetical protein
MTITDYKAYCRDQPCQTETVHQVQGLLAAGFIGRRSPTMPPTDSHPNARSATIATTS